MSKQQYNIRINPSLLQEIRDKSKADDRSVNWSIEKAIELYCKKK